MGIRIVNLMLTLVFLLFMAAQFNDPDPVFWAGIYGTVAVIAAFATFAKFSIPLILITLGASLGVMLYLMPSVFELLVHHHPGELMNRMAADKPYIEEAREALGLLVSVIALIYFHTLAKRRGESEDTHAKAAHLKGGSGDPRPSAPPVL